MDIECTTCRLRFQIPEEAPHAALGPCPRCGARCLIDSGGSARSDASSSEAAPGSRPEQETLSIEPNVLAQLRHIAARAQQQSAVARPPRPTPPSELEVTDQPAVPSVSPNAAAVPFELRRPVQAQGSGAGVRWGVVAVVVVALLFGTFLLLVSAGAFDEARRPAPARVPE